MGSLWGPFRVLSARGSPLPPGGAPQKGLGVGVTGWPRCSARGGSAGVQQGLGPSAPGWVVGLAKKRENGIFEPLSVCGGGGGVVGVGWVVGLAWVCCGFCSFSPCCLVCPVSAWINAWK